MLNIVSRHSGISAWNVWCVLVPNQSGSPGHLPQKHVSWREKGWLTGLLWYGLWWSGVDFGVLVWTLGFWSAKGTELWLWGEQVVRLRKCSIFSYICMLPLFLAMYVRTKNSAHIEGAAVLDQSTHRISSSEQAALRYILVHYTLECTCYIRLHMLSR